MTAKRPCLLLVAYTAAVVIAVTAFVATEGPWVRDGVMPERSEACALQPHVFFHPEDAQREAESMRASADFDERELTKPNVKAAPDAVKILESSRSSALRCAENLDALATWHEGHFNWRDACSISFWLALLLVPAWVFCARRRIVELDH